MAEADRVKAAEIMFGSGSKQHKAAIRRFGGKKGGGPKAQVLNPKKMTRSRSSGGGGGGGRQPRDSKGRWS